ncbi:MAG: class I SAM-dependent methyltransferase [Ignavibacteria bacterium]|jgi:SAM-dependent methyltransferase
MQNEIFKKYEANNYYLRNRNKQNKFKYDIILDIMEKYDLVKNKISVLEIGCSDGWRLEKLKLKYKDKVNLFGVEPSKLACDDIKMNKKYVECFCCTSDKFSIKRKFDIILVPFVLHWIDRNKLISTVYNIDRHLKDNGFLIICDFWTNGFNKTRYHHITDNEIWTYKQNYQNIFVSTGTYINLFNGAYDYEKGNYKSGVFSIYKDSNNIAQISLLKKVNDYLYIKK